LLFTFKFKFKFIFIFTSTFSFTSTSILTLVSYSHLTAAMRETAARRAAENPGMWPPVVLPPVPAPKPKRSVSDLSDAELLGKRYDMAVKI
jgi:hypothetical protein